MTKIETAIKTVFIFLTLYFLYYFLLRFIQAVLQGFLIAINKGLEKFIYVIGTPAHELAHLLVAIICLSRINKVKLLPSNGQPGFVNYSIRSSIPFLIHIKNFFIGIAPALINIPLFVFIEEKFILHESIWSILNPSILLSKEGYITLGLFLILISCIAPSHEDFKGMFKGLIIFSIIIFGITYFGGKVINITSIDITWILVILLYYFEIIITLLIISSIINYNNFIKVIYRVLVEAGKHTFTKN